jgi:hypothetical protein
MAGNLRENVERQTLQGFRVCVAENGDGVGACARIAWKPDAIVTSEQHQSAAKNAAIDYVERNGGTHFATFDDDDYYGPGYLEEVSEAFELGFDLVGKSQYFIRFDESGRTLLLEGEGENAPARILAGPTISARIWPGMPRFRTLDWGEDNFFCMDCLAAGARIWSTSRREFVYRRRGGEHGHTYPLTDEALENCARTVGVVYDCGVCGLDNLSLTSCKMQRLEDPGVNLNRYFAAE